MRSALALLLPAALGLTGCQTHECDPSSAVVDDSDGGGAVPYVPGSDTWVSAPGEGPWLDFPGGRKVTFTFPKAFRPTSYRVDAFISTDPNQGSGGGTSTGAAGQPGEVTNVTAEGFEITNQTCAEYYLRVVVTADPEAGAADASRDR